MQLPGLPERPPKATRLHIHLEFESDKRCRIHVTDLGLGEMYPASEWSGRRRFCQTGAECRDEADRTIRKEGLRCLVWLQRRNL